MERTGDCEEGLRVLLRVGGTRAGLCSVRFRFPDLSGEKTTVLSIPQSRHGAENIFKVTHCRQKQIVISRFTSLFWLFKARGCQSLRAGQNALPLPLLERLLPFSCQPVSCLEFVPGVASAAIGTTGVASQNT